MSPKDLTPHLRAPGTLQESDPAVTAGGKWNGAAALVTTVVAKAGPTAGWHLSC